MLLKIIITLVAAIVSGVFGRMGGSDKYNTKWRDFGCAFIVCFLMALWYGWHWTLILCFGLQFGALTTYFKKKGTSARWYHWLIVGFAWSLSTIPYVWAMGLWEGFGVRSFVLPLLVMGWCVLISNAVVEEFGRYLLLALSIPLLFIFNRKGKK